MVRYKRHRIESAELIVYALMLRLTITMSAERPPPRIRLTVFTGKDDSF